MSFPNEPAFDEAKTSSIELAVGTSLRYQVPKMFIPTFINFVILERVAGKICIHCSQFSETKALCCKNISIMPALCLIHPPDSIMLTICWHNLTDTQTLLNGSRTLSPVTQRLSHNNIIYFGMPLFLSFLPQN